jgi:hypothetical protein
MVPHRWQFLLTNCLTQCESSVDKKDNLQLYTILCCLQADIRVCVSSASFSVVGVRHSYHCRWTAGAFSPMG